MSKNPKSTGSKRGDTSLSSFVVLVKCQSCGEVHAAQFKSEKDFHALRCRVDDSPLFRGRNGYAKAFADFQNDVMRGAVAV